MIRKFSAMPEAAKFAVTMFMAGLAFAAWIMTWSNKDAESISADIDRLSDNITSLDRTIMQDRSDNRLVDETQTLLIKANTDDINDHKVEVAKDLSNLTTKIDEFEDNVNKQFDELKQNTEEARKERLELLKKLSNG